MRKRIDEPMKDTIHPFDKSQMFAPSPFLRKNTYDAMSDVPLKKLLMFG